MIKYAIALVFCFMLSAWLGCKKDTTTINRRPVLAGDTVVLRGVAGRESADSAYNTVFFDLSTALQTPVLRTSWDLGFYSGPEFRVIINHAVGATITALTKTNLNDVTAADTAALVARFNLDTDTLGDLTTVDPVDLESSAYLSGTAIPEIPEAASASRVLIMNRGTVNNLGRRNWIKMKITRSGSGYSVTWGTMSATAGQYSSYTINKDASYNFRYRSFTNGAVTYEPAKGLWDVAWGHTTYKGTNAAGAAAAAVVPDFMMINFVNGVKAAQVMVSPTTTFDTFNSTQLEGITFSGLRDVIGVTWRNLARSTIGALAINTDRFYLIQDSEGNIYKLSFQGGGSRGFPTLWYILVKEGPEPEA
jgi:hypothetical protein